MSRTHLFTLLTIAMLVANCKSPGEKIVDDFKKVDSSLQHANAEIKDTLLKLDSQLEISKAMMRALDEDKFAEGKFIKLEKIDNRYYTLYLKTANDSIVSFMIAMTHSLNRSLLNKGKPNIRLTYAEFTNPFTHKLEKVVKTWVPLRFP